MFTQDNYVKFMRAYMGMFGVTLATNPDYFWGANAVTKFSYFNATIGDATSPAGFFARMCGLTFLILVAGNVRFGVSDRAFTKQTAAWNAVTLKLMYDCATFVGTKRAPSPFVQQTWQLQLLVNIALVAWGAHVAGGVQKLIKAE